MNKFFISRSLVALTFAVFLAAFIAPNTEKLEGERRRIAAFPEAPSKIRSISVKKFFKDVDAFFTDRFPLRSYALSLSISLQDAGGGSMDMNKCYKGKENWLFLGNSYGRCVDKLQGAIGLSGNTLKLYTAEYKKKNDAAKKHGIDFFVFIGPNKSSIYPEYLPPVVIPARRRFIAPLVDSLSKSGVQVYDPTERLFAAKADCLLYYRTDTHWNARGAYEAFADFGKRAGLPAPPILSFEEAPARRGDLVDIGGYTTFPLSAGDNFTAHWSVTPALHEKDGLITNARAVSEKTAWVFGDSFTEALSPYITATFKAVRFFSHGEFKAAMSSGHSKPDMILWIIVERNFAKSS